MWYHASVEFFFGIAMFLNAAFFIPQAIKLFRLRDSKEISLISFSGFLGIQLITVLHGDLRNDPILMYGTLLSMSTCGLVVFLTIFYRLKKS